MKDQFVIVCPITLKYCSEEDFELRGIYTDVCSVKKVKEEKKAIQYLKPQATSAILSAYGVDTSKHRRNRMMLILLYDSGARVQELADLNISSLHIGEENPYITLVGKGRKSRNVPLMAKTVKHLNVYIQEFHPGNEEAPLFYSILGGKPHRLSTNSISLVLKNAADMAKKTAMKSLTMYIVTSSEKQKLWTFTVMACRCRL